MRTLTHHWHSRWHTSIVLCGALVALHAAPAAADCSLPDAAIVWSHPAQGDTDVPTNTDLWLQMSGWDGPARVWLGDEAVPGLALPYGYDLGELAPHTEYELRIEPLTGDVTFELSFTTGGGPAAPNPNVAPGPLATSRASEYEGTPLCRAALSTQDCFDTGQNTYFEFTPSADAVGWVIVSDAGYRPINLWPGECGPPRLFGHDSSTPCVTLHAIDAIGATHASEHVCAGAAESNATDGSPTTTATRIDDAGCALRGDLGTSPARAPLALLGLGLMLAWRSVRRGRQSARAGG